MCKACEVVRSVIKPCDVVSVRDPAGAYDQRKGIVYYVDGTTAEVVFTSGARIVFPLARLMRVAPAIGG